MKKKLEKLRYKMCDALIDKLSRNDVVRGINNVHAACRNGDWVSRNEG